MSKTLSVSESDRRLRYWFDACPHAAIALSGGVDSCLVAWYARACLGRENVTAYIADSPSLKRKDLSEAEAFCAKHDIPLRKLATQELHNPDYASNPNNRCYFCKTTLYDDLISTVQRTQASTDKNTWICSGANLDDSGDYRPGLKAAAEHHIYHTLLLCELNKESIRALAQQQGLACWDKAASPCLSSRIPYGQIVDAEKLARIEAAESYLQDKEFKIVRVRHDEDTARIEVPTQDIDKLQKLFADIDTKFKQLGFKNTEVDVEGFVSGKLNRSIQT